MRPPGPSRPPRDPKTAALAVLNLAHLVSSGEVRLPAAGQGPTRVEGRVVVHPAVHAVICGFHTSTRWENAGGPPVAQCCGCGLLHLVEDDEASPDPPAAEATVTTLRRTAR